MGVDADDTIIGGKGADTVQFDANVSGLTDLELKNVEKVEIVDINLDGYGIRLDLWLQTESLQISGAGENDTILGGYRADTITGGAGADALYGNDGADLFVADASDLIDGGLGDDTVRYATGFEAFADGNLVNVERVVITNSGNAAYDFSDQSEKLNISGGAGSDTLHGGSGADTLSGGSGNDLIIAVDTDGLLDGGAGTDTVRFAAAVSAANLADQDLVAIEKVEIAGTGAAAYDFSAQSEGLNITGSAYVDSVTGGKGADSISGGVGADSLDGGAGNDTLFGGVGDDTLVGGTGNGEVLALNKVKGVRAALAVSTELVAAARQEQNANCLAIGAQQNNLEQAKALITSALENQYFGAIDSSRRIINVGEYENLGTIEGWMIEG
jgi:Ca2+-binding RTX toxin-like protein